MKIARIVENHFYPATELPDPEIVSFLQHFEHYPSDYQKTWREYNACLFATGYDENTAAATFLQNGPVLNKEIVRGDKSRIKCIYISCVRITQNEDGIILNFTPQFELKYKIDAAYETVKARYKEQLSRLYSANDLDEETEDSIISYAFTEFFSCPAKHIMSVPKEFSSSLRTGLECYLRILKRTPYNLLDTVPQSAMNAPQDWLPITTSISTNLEVFVPFSDFTVELTSSAQRAHLFGLAYDRTLETLAKKYEEHPEWDAETIYSSAEVRSWFHRNTFDAATDPLKNFIVKVAYGKYKLNFINILNSPPSPPEPEPEESQDNNDEFFEPLIF